MGLAQIATITVTYNPDIALLREQLQALPSECPGVLVDNASETALQTQIETLATERPGTVLLRNADNAGLAAAINQGAKAVKEAYPQARFLLLLDQDSLPDAWENHYFGHLNWDGSADPDTDGKPNLQEYLDATPP